MQMLRNFSFVIDGVLAGCAHPDGSGDCDEALAELTEKGITALASLDETGIPLYLIADHDFHYLHLPVPDFGVPRNEQVLQFIDFVNKERAGGRKVAVHCGAGYGRTGTMIACYLISTGMSPEEAIRHVRRKRPGSIETREQEQFILHFDPGTPSGSPEPKEGALAQLKKRFTRKKKA